MTANTLDLAAVSDLFKVNAKEILNLVADGELKAGSDGTFAETDVRAFISRNTYQAA